MQTLAIASFVVFNPASAGFLPAYPSLLSKDFSYGLFDKLPDFDDALQSLDSLAEGRLENLRDKLTDMALQNGVEEIMLGLKHKHFDISADHFLGEELSSSSDLSVMRPREKCLLGSATPVSFSFMDGVWQPYEWTLNNSEAARNYDVLQEKQAFLQNITDIITSEQLDGIFGLHVKHRGIWEDTFGTVESPGDSEHELHIRPTVTNTRPLDGSSSAEARTVAWPLSGPQNNQWGCVRHTKIECNRHKQCFSHPRK